MTGRATDHNRRGLTAAPTGAWPGRRGAGGHRHRDLAGRRPAGSAGRRGRIHGAPHSVGAHRAGPARIAGESLPAGWNRCPTPACPRSARGVRQPNHPMTASTGRRTGCWCSAECSPEAPRRWDLVALHSPEPGGELCVKRVVGLPGERIEIRAGNVWVDGQMARKSLDEQRASGVLVDDMPAANAAASACRWRDDAGHWRCEDSQLTHAADREISGKPDEEIHWLEFIARPWLSDDGPDVDTGAARSWTRVPTIRTNCACSIRCATCWCME